MTLWFVVGLTMFLKKDTGVCILGVTKWGQFKDRWNYTIFDSMSRSGFSTFLIFFLVTAIQGFSQENQVFMERYLDSCTKYLKKGRPDLVVQYNMKADTLSNTLPELSFNTKYQIQNNYFWAFHATNRNELKRFHLKKQFDLIQQERKEGRDHFILNQVVLGNLAASFTGGEQSDSSRKYYELAIDLAMENKDPIYIASTLNNMGMFMISIKDWESAKDYFFKAVETARADTIVDSILYYSIRDNIADYYFHSKDSIRAMKIVETNLKELRPERRSIEKIMRWGEKLLNSYIAQNQYTKADSLIHRLTKLLPINKLNQRFKNKLNLLKAEITVVDRLNIPLKLDSLNAELSTFMEEYLLFLKERNTSNSRLLLEYTTQSTNRELKVAQLAIDAAKEKAFRNRVLLFVFLFIFLLIILLIVVNYRRRIQLEHQDNELKEKALEISKLEKEKIRYELENKSQDFSKLLMQNTLQEDWSKHVIDELQAIRKLEGEEASQQIRALIIELRQKGGMYQKLHELQKGMDEANTHFFKELEKRYPDLTKAEKETCGLIRMNMQSKEIALIRNISPSSVRKLRQRIRGKLKLTSDEGLYEYIQGI